ncbi:MAG: TonB-dependent receptor [Thermoanaerobaculia bacterium]
MRCNTEANAWLMVAVLLLGAAVAGRVDATTTGQLAGRVVDDGGVPLPGVSVTAGSPTQIGGIQSTQTDAQGWFQYPRLNPGYFTVRLELDGFLTQELTEVQVRLDRMTRLLVTLPVGTFADQVVVTETTPVVDPQRISTGQTFTSDFIEEAAIGLNVRYAYSQILLQAAGAASENPGTESGGGALWAISVLGSTGSENVFQVDGLDTSDPYYGGAMTMIRIDSIQELAFESGGFEAEFGRATGGVINVLTKSGSNTLAGSVDVRFRNENLETSGDHYDPDEEESGVRIVGATLGGRFVRDRAWYFASVENQLYKATPTGAPTTFEERINRGFVKVTGQATPSWLLLGKYHRGPWEWLNAGSGPFKAPEATVRYEVDGTILQAEASGVLSPSLLWEMQIGSHSVDEDWGPMSGDSEPINHYNLDTGLETGNTLEMFYRNSDRNQLGTALTWLVGDALGSHEFKAGGEYHQTSLDLHTCYTGLTGGGFCRAGEPGYAFLDFADGAGNSIPFLMTVRTPPGPVEVTGTFPSLFVQDTWRLLPSLSIKLGLRWDRSIFDDDAGEEVADLAMLQPRVGVTWDVAGNGRNLLRASWGRFMNSSFLRLPRFGTTTADVFEDWLSCSLEGLTDPEICQGVAAIEGLTWRSDPEGWDPAGWLLLDTFGSFPRQIAPDLEPTYADTLILGFERELFRRTSLELSFVDKATRDIFDDTCIGNYPTPAPGADCSTAIIANIDEARRDYTAWILNFESRALDRLHVLASYTNSDAKGSISTGALATNDFDLYPYHWENRYGYLEYHRKHRVKVSGYVFLPWDFALGVNGVWGSPFRWTPVQPARLVDPRAWGLIFVEPRGNREGDEWAQLDLQVTKSFRLGRVRLRLIGTVVNLFDSENAINVCDNVNGCGDFELGDPTAWQLPRRYELGLRVEF